MKMLFVVLALVGQFANADELFNKYDRERAQFEKEIRTSSQSSVQAKVQTKNNAEMGKLTLTAGPKPSGSKKRFDKLTLEQANELYQAVANNPVASLDKYSKYDPQDQGIGFCFGRAMTVHLEALFDGVSKHSIKKMWALGHLKTGDNNWRYHVTTIVKGNRSWLAIDPIMGGVLTVDAWYTRMRDFDSDGLMRVYISEPEKFGPSSGKYGKSEMLDPFYNEYFSDLMAYFRKRSKEQ